jgi:hypothetical protein
MAEQENGSHAYRIVPVEEVPEGPLHIFPVLPGFESPDPYSSEDTFERLPIPLSEGRAYVVVNGARPIVKDGDNYSKSASEAADAKSKFNDAKGDYQTKKGDFDERTKSRWGLVGLDMPEIGKTVTSRPVYTREVTDVPRFVSELGTKRPEIAGLELGTKFRIREGQTTNRGKKVTPELIEAEIRKLFDRLGIDAGEQGLDAEFIQGVTDVDWQKVIDELHAGRLSFSSVSATPVQRLDSRPYNPSRGTKK